MLERLAHVLTYDAEMISDLSPDAQYERELVTAAKNCHDSNKTDIVLTLQALHKKLILTYAENWIWDCSQTVDLDQPGEAKWF